VFSYSLRHLKHRLGVCDSDLFEERLETGRGERGNIMKKIGKVLVKAVPAALAAGVLSLVIAGCTPEGKEAPVGKPPAAEHPAGEHPKADHPDAEDTKAKKPDAEHPGSEHPTSEHPSSDHPTSEHPK
jgi:hypothetical protein